MSDERPVQRSLEAAIVARRFYLDGKQKNDIADELGISRFKVARLLDDARAQGIVRISVDMPAEIDVPTGERLAAAFGIRRAIVVRALPNAAESIGPLIGVAAAEHLAAVLSADDVLGVSWGTSLTQVVDAVGTLPAAEIVQLVGGAQTADINANGVELLRRFASKSNATAYPLHVPLHVRSKAIADELRTDPNLARTLDRFDAVTVALVGIGSWSPSLSSLYRELPELDRAQLVVAGAAADVCTVVLDSSGQVLESDALDRTIAIGVDQLRRVPEVIAVAGGQGKSLAIAAALRSGLIGTIVTDSLTAAELLDA